MILAGVAVTGRTATAVLGQRSPGPPLRQPAPTGTAYGTGDVGRMPAAPGVPEAATDPAAVGSDPALLHFSVDELAHDAELADDLAGLLPGVRLDQARRCAMPFRFSRLPAGTRLRSCRVALPSGNDGLFRDSHVEFGDGERTVSVGASNFPGGDHPRSLQAGPYRVFADPDGRTWTMKTDGIFFDLLSSRKPPTPGTTRCP